MSVYNTFLYKAETKTKGSKTMAIIDLDKYSKKVQEEAMQVLGINKGKQDGQTIQQNTPNESTETGQQKEQQNGI